MTQHGELRGEIEQTRAELGETVEALAAKADVKARVERAASDTALEVRAKAAQVRRTLADPPIRWVLVGLGALAAALTAIVVGRRRR